MILEYTKLYLLNEFLKRLKSYSKLFSKAQYLKPVNSFSVLDNLLGSFLYKLSKISLLVCL